MVRPAVFTQSLFISDCRVSFVLVDPWGEGMLPSSVSVWLSSSPPPPRSNSTLLHAGCYSQLAHSFMGPGPPPAARAYVTPVFWHRVKWYACYRDAASIGSQVWTESRRGGRVCLHSSISSLLLENRSSWKLCLTKPQVLSCRYTSSFVE